METLLASRFKCSRADSNAWPAGIDNITDLEEFTEEFLDDIENRVRTDGFKAFVDFDSKAVREAYFGMNLGSYKEFTFRPLDRTKLLRLGNAAKLRSSQKLQK